MIDVTEQDINYLNVSVKEINDKVGREFISLESDPDGEDDSVIIFEDGLETWSGYSFECTEMYLKGIKLGISLKETPEETIKIDEIGRIKDFNPVGRMLFDDGDFSTRKESTPFYLGFIDKCPASAIFYYNNNEINIRLEGFFRRESIDKIINQFCDKMENCSKLGMSYIFSNNTINIKWELKDYEES